MVAHVVQRHRRERHEDEAHAKADENERRQDVSDISARRGQTKKHQHAYNGKCEASGRHPARPDARHQLAGDAGTDHDARGERQEEETRLKRAVAEHTLEEEREEQEHGEQTNTDEERRKVGATAIAVGEDAQRQKRMRRLRLDDDEDNEQCDTDGKEGQRRRCAPSFGPSLGDAVDDRYETQGGSDGTGDVVRRISRRPRLAHERDCQKHSDDGDGGVDQQGPVPVGVLGEQAAGDKADRCAAAGDRTEDAERARTLLGLGECHRDERQRGRRQ